MRCSQTLETSAEGIWAAGDPCEYDSVVHGRRLRVEHFEVAAAQGAPRGRGDARARRARTTRSPTSGRTSPTGARSSTSGRPRSGTARSSAARSTTASSRSSTSTRGRLAAALTVGRSDDLEHAKRLIAAGEHLGDRADALADAETDLAAL